jgi:hypothetical protein
MKPHIFSLEKKGGRIMILIDKDANVFMAADGKFLSIDQVTVGRWIKKTLWQSMRLIKKARKQ